MAYQNVSGVLAAALLLLFAMSTANAETNSRCRWEDGSFICEATSETATSKTTTLCGASSIEGACKTWTVTKQPPPGPGTSESATFDRRAEAKKAERLRKSGYRAPGEVTLDCPPPMKMTARDGCQP
jgi:hypothetical protein